MLRCPPPRRPFTAVRNETSARSLRYGAVRRMDTPIDGPLGAPMNRRHDAASGADGLALSRALALHPLVARVLAARGRGDDAGTRRYLAPRLSDLSRPDGMADRRVAAERLAAAVRLRERIVVF